MKDQIMLRPARHTPTTQELADQPHGERKRRTMAAIAAALMLTAGVGGTATALASNDASDSEPTVVAAQARAAQATNHVAGPLDDVTLDELADQLARLGLEVHITPTGNDRPVSEDRGTDEHDPMTKGTTAEGAATTEDRAEGAQAGGPFEGMTQAEIEALSDEDFFAKLDAAGVDPDDHKPDQDAGHDHSPPAPIAKVAVDGDTIDTAGLSPEIAEKAQAIWQRFVALIPADQRQMVSGFELVAGPDEGGHVYQQEADPTKWVLGVATGLSGEDLDFLLIHEFAHLLTLQAKEVPPSTSDAVCPTYHTGEGCALSGSTIAEFVGKFWPQDVSDKINGFLEKGDDAGLAKYRQENRDQFVSDYAATNPGEDLAETFAIFVIEDRPTGDSIADQKVNLLWADPAMVTLRNQIRAAL